MMLVAILMLHTHGGLIGSGLSFLSSTLQMYTSDYSWGLLMLGLILLGLIIVSLRIDWFNGFPIGIHERYVDVAGVPMYGGIQFNSSSLIIIY